jgi:cGMP-dependent protein kinase
VSCYTLTADVFKSILEPNLYEYFTNKIFLEDNTIELKDLDNVKELGSGNFGSVNLVRNKKNKFTYAIKALNLEQIKLENLEECVEVERDVLLKIDHPFIMKMVKYLKNDNYIFFINEYIKGKELWEVIRDIGLLNKEQTQYYGGSILLAIDYLHKQKIIYRDIKPENVMVSIKGYIKIIDFGTVKEIQDRTSTIIGTSHYMAPEITKGEGYSFQVDIWSIAICMYEFFCGKLPFGEDYDDPMDIYRAVSQEELTFPSFVKDKEFMSLMNKMLRKSPTNRLWKFKQIKEDPYFKDFDWNKLISLSYPPPYKLKMKEEKDTGGQTIPYLSYLASKDVKRGGKKKKSNRQIKFEKWLKNF